MKIITCILIYYLFTSLINYLSNEYVNVFAATNRKINRLRKTSRYYSDMPYKDAKGKALIISKAAGVTLGEIINIDYSWCDNNIYHEDNVLYESMDCCESSIEAIDLQAEDLSTSDTVSVTWEIL